LLFGLLDELIKNLNSENDEDRDKAVAAADQYLQSTVKKSAPDRTGVNRTVINKGAYDTSPQQLSSSQEPSFTDQGICCNHCHLLVLCLIYFYVIEYVVTFMFMV